TLDEAATRAGVDIETVIRFRNGRSRQQDNAALAMVVSEYETGLATLGRIQNRRRPIRVPARVDEELGAFLGYLIGDGHISTVKRTIGLTTGDEEQADTFVVLVRTLFGLEPRKTWDEGRWRIKLSSNNLKDLLIHLGLQTGVCARRK